MGHLIDAVKLCLRQKKRGEIKELKGGGELRREDRQVKRRDGVEEVSVGDKRRRDKLGKEESRHGVYGALQSENKSLLLFYHSYMTAGIVKHT